MHARYCSPVTGRFLGVDPGNAWDPAAPQSWNQYAYVLNNPIKLIDPDGNAATLPNALRLVEFHRGVAERLDRVPVVGRYLGSAYRFIAPTTPSDLETAHLDLVPLGSVAGRAGRGAGRSIAALADSFISSASGRGVKVLNSNLGHAAERAVQRAGFSTTKEATQALRTLGDEIARRGVPEGAITDSARKGRILVPFGDGGAAVYQITSNGKLRLKTVLKLSAE